MTCSRALPRSTVERRPQRRALLAALPALLALASGAAAQAVVGPSHSGGLGTAGARIALVSDGATRIADPKLAGGGASLSFHLIPAGASAAVAAEVLRDGAVVATLYTGTIQAGAPPTALTWDGRDAQGDWLPTGAYQMRVRFTSAPGSPLTLPLSIVRLGIVGIEALADLGHDEFPMVYFMKGAAYGYFATPQQHEYFSTADTGELSELDLDNGDPRTSPAPHPATDSPALEGAAYENDRYNYPVSYIAGRQPHFRATFGSSGTTAAGQAMPAGYPVAGWEIRASVSDSLGAWTAESGALAPGGTATFRGSPLPGEVTRQDRALTWTFEARPSAPAGAPWSPIPGSITTVHRFYTLYGAPFFAADATGSQYAGPWVEVAETFHQWRSALGIEGVTSAGVSEAFFRGFFGQQGSLATAIEGVMYDAFPLGGDGGANHYFNSTTKTIDLSRLLNAHANGMYVNCSDVASSCSTMISMLGVPQVQLVRLSAMTLKAIWGIGSPAYTTSLWGGAHSFSYHHVVTRDAGTSICDSCMCLDEDGTPQSTPGIPGWNYDRPWAGPSGYAALSAYNPVTKILEPLPKLK